MPHTSRKRNNTPQKRRKTVDEDGWTRIASHHDPTKYGKRASDQTRIDPHRVADEMTVEKVSERYTLIEKKWQASESCKRLIEAMREALQGNTGEVKSCICFGSGSMSGLRHDWIQRHDVALYQIAAFKTAVDTIETTQSRRLVAYAQEPAYNLLDETFLASLQIEKVDSPNGWDLIESSSFCYCPGAEQYVSIMVVKKDPGFYMAGPLPWLREKQVENACVLPGHCGEDWNADLKEQRLHMIDKFMDEHDVCTLPDFDAADYPFYDQVLYWRKANAD
jgi:hypothetical protein